MPSAARTAHVNRALDTVYAHHGEACELLAVGAVQGAGTAVVPILENWSENVGTGYSGAGEYIYDGFTARFRAHELESKSLVPEVGMTLIPTDAFAGHAAFEITSGATPDGRKANQVIVQISPVDIPT